MTITAVSHIALNTADLDRFRRFYEGVLEIPHGMTMRMDHEPFLRHATFHLADQLVVHVFEVPGYDPQAQGIGRSMGERGRVDHFGFMVSDESALRLVADRLRAAGATDASVRAFGPFLSVHVTDPDGLELEINCPNPAYDVRDDEAVEELSRPDLIDRAGAAACAVA